MMERGLIEEAGRRDSPGRPILYQTTASFLALFGIESLAALPDYDLAQTLNHLQEKNSENEMEDSSLIEEDSVCVES